MESWVPYWIDSMIVFASIVLCAMMIFLINVNLKWLPSLVQVNCFFGIYLTLKTYYFIESYAGGAPLILGLSILPAALLFGPLVDQFTRSTLRMRTIRLKNKLNIYIFVFGSFLIVSTLFTNNEFAWVDSTPLTLALFNAAECLYVMLFVGISTRYFVPTLVNLIRGKLYTIGYGEPTFKWLRGVWLVMSSIWVISCYEQIATLWGVDLEVGWKIASSVVDLLFLIGLTMITALYASKPHEENEVERCEIEIKYEKSGLDDTRATKILADVEAVMENRKLFLEEISLPKLAKEIGTQPHYLSQAVNQQRNINFFELIARYRVDHAKTLLCTEQEKPILDIALESGFNSKSTFNHSFKKITGFTPSQYRRTAQN